MNRPSRSILDTVDTTINSESPLLTGLTNGGPVTIGESMPLPVIQPQSSAADPFKSTPLTNAINDDWEDNWQDTDPMSFEDPDIFEHEAFLGIRIGKKAKARGAAKKAARVAKRAAKRAAKEAEAASYGQDSVWKQPDTITPTTYDPLGLNPAPAIATNASMLETLNNPASTFNLQNALNTAFRAADAVGVPLGLTGFENTNTAEYGLDDDENTGQPAKKRKNNTLLYVGIGVAVLVILIVALKSRK